jgi:hypothetical protein
MAKKITRNNVSVAEFERKHIDLLTQSDDVKRVRKWIQSSPQYMTLSQLEGPDGETLSAICAEFNHDENLIRDLRGWWFVRLLKPARTESPAAYRVRRRVGRPSYLE